MKIKIIDFSIEAASKTKGIYLKEIIEQNINDIDSIIIDFSGITRFASPFFNNSLAALALKYGFDKINKIQLDNISPVGQDTYDTSMINAKMLSDNKNFSNEISKIIQETPKDTGD